jgi:pentatricopeptide repeat protein
MTNPGITQYRDLIGQATQALATGTFEAALPALNRAAALLPRESAAVAWRAYVLSKLGRFDEAVVQWQEARQRGARLVDDERWAFECTVSLARVGRYAEAAELYGQMLARGVSSERRATVLVNLADMLVLANCPDLTEAVELYREAVRAYPHFPAAHWGLAAALVRTGEPEEAQAELAAAMRLDPQWQSFSNPSLFLVPPAVIHLHRALGWNHLGHHAEAERELQAHLAGASDDACRVEQLPR